MRVAGQIRAVTVKQVRFTPIVARSSATVQPLAGVSHAHLHCHGREFVSVAAAITAARYAQTGAPRFFAQVLFAAANERDHFVGGRVNTAPQMYVHGLVREDRSIEIKQALMSQRLKEIVQNVGITAEDVWIYLQNIPATQMIESGLFWPVPGDEAKWEKRMTPEKRASLPKKPQ